MGSAGQCHMSLIAMPNDSIVYHALGLFSTAYRPVHTYLSISICLVGIISNVCNIIVLTRPSMKTQVNTILCGIASCDMTVMLSNLIFITHYNVVASKECNPSHFSMGWGVFTYLHSQLSVIGHSSSVWLSVALGHLRYKTLRQSGGQVRMRRVDSEIMHSYVAIALVLASVALFNTPNCLSYRVIQIPLEILCLPDDVNAANQTVYLFDLSVLALQNSCLVFRLAFWISGALFKMIPCILLTVFITLLVRILKEVKKRRARLHQTAAPPPGSPAANGRSSSRRKMESKEESVDRTTKMLITVICVFLATEIPQGLMSVMTGFFGNEFRKNIYNNLGELLDLLSLINACATFVIYCSMSKQYRSEFAKIFLPKRIVLSRTNPASTYSENPSVMVPNKISLRMTDGGRTAVTNLSNQCNDSLRRPSSPPTTHNNLNNSSLINGGDLAEKIQLIPLQDIAVDVAVIVRNESMDQISEKSIRNWSEGSSDSEDRVITFQTTV